METSDKREALVLDFGPMLRFLRAQPGARFAQARRSKEFDGRGAKSLGGKSQRVVLPFFIADDGHFLDVFTLLHHEAHVAPVSVSLPAFECFKNNEGVDLPAWFCLLSEAQNPDPTNGRSMRSTPTATSGLAKSAQKGKVSDSEKIFEICVCFSSLQI